jgi:hypothetical protein
VLAIISSIDTAENNLQRQSLAIQTAEKRLPHAAFSRFYRIKISVLAGTGTYGDITEQITMGCNHFRGGVRNIDRCSAR